MSKKIKSKKFSVAGWTQYNANMKQFDDANPGLTDQEWADAENAVVEEIRKNGYKFGGNYHQYGLHGCPVMNDGSVFMVSMRHWGGIMCRVYGGVYTDYAWENDLGKIPLDRGKAPRWMTDAEIAERERKYEEARKNHEEAAKRLALEQKREKRNEHKRNVRYALKYLASIDESGTGSVFCTDVGVQGLAKVLVKILEDAQSADCPKTFALKWILDPQERTRVEQERKQARARWLENYKSTFKDDENAR